MGRIESSSCDLTCDMRQKVMALGLVSILLLGFIMMPSKAYSESVIATIATGTNSHDVAVNPTTSKVYVAHSFTGLVSVIDGSTDSVIDSITLSCTFLIAIAANPLTNTVYALCNDIPTGQLYVIDGSTDTETTSVAVGSNSRGVDVNPTTNTVYVANSGSDSVTVIDGSTNTVITTVGVGCGPQGVAVNPTTNMVYSANNCGHNVTVLDGSTNMVTTSISGINNALEVDVNPSTNMVYVTGPNSNAVYVIDGSTDTVAATIAVADNPYGIAVNEVTNKIYVTRHQSSLASIISGSTNGVIEALTVGSMPLGVDTNAVNQKSYVANTASDTVSVIADITAPLPPDTRITKAIDSFSDSIRNGGYTLSDSMKFKFRGIDDSGQIAGFECRLDNAASFTACTSPTTFSDLSYGKHTFRVRAIDAAGNVDPTPSVWKWRVLTPAQGVQKLTDMVNALQDLQNDGIKKSLAAPLKGIIENLNDGNQENDASVCSKLDSFTSQVDVKLRNGQLTTEQAAKLEKLANQIMAVLDCD